jgi:hypothetical protein
MKTHLIKLSHELKLARNRHLGTFPWNKRTIFSKNKTGKTMQKHTENTDFLKMLKT